MKNSRLWLRLSPALIEGLDEIAKKHGYSSRQEVIRVLIHDAVLKERGIIVG
jgi:metal-responsive CopG/Arc/MetJ family transcriptional regulator